jgi:hypothetical protein
MYAALAVLALIGTLVGAIWAIGWESQQFLVGVAAASAIACVVAAFRGAFPFAVVEGTWALNCLLWWWAHWPNGFRYSGRPDRDPDEPTLIELKRKTIWPPKKDPVGTKRDRT